MADYSGYFESRKIALVGVSGSPRKFGNAVHRTLKDRGFEVFPVHPSLKEINGSRCFEHLGELPPEVSTLVVAVAPHTAVEVIREAIDSPMKRIWFQQGADFSQAAEAARNAGMEVVSNKCVLLYAPPVTGFHGFHRFLARLIGRL
ncbi:conserved hypothetical protein [Candidatus Zixiibacteriota bacterium]|nr:conserved hypothetical protein [candidate division Zixibacteria bacterium]